MSVGLVPIWGQSGLEEQDPDDYGRALRQLLPVTFSWSFAFIEVDPCLGPGKLELLVFS